MNEYSRERGASSWQFSPKENEWVMSKLHKQESFINLAPLDCATADKNWQGSFLSLSVWPRHQEEQVPQEDKDGGIFPGNGREVPFWSAQVAIDQVLGECWWDLDR
jgi:hypothetical protein